MHDEDGEAHGAIEMELAAVRRETARLSRELDALESDLTRVVELLLQATGRGDLALDVLHCLGNPRGTLH